MNNKYKLFYPNREIGVSHYPMPATRAKDYSVNNISFLNMIHGEKNQILIYIHIPFCEKMCSFCPYNKVMFEAKKVEEYLKSLYKEIISYAKTAYIQNSVVNGVYFGGGTPNLLSIEQITSLIRLLKKNFVFDKYVEMTVEGNPHLFDREKMEAIKAEGVNRISLGVQTFNQRLEKIIEVPHNKKDACRAIMDAREIGFEKISIDLMYNLPGQTLKEWLQDISKAIEMQIDHITLFHLVVIPETRLHKKLELLKVSTGSLNTELSMYEKARHMLLEAGYKQESTYDFAKPEKGSFYGEMHYKKHQDILGMGVGAFGEINKHCYINNGNFRDYINTLKDNKLPIMLQDTVTKSDKIYAKLSMGLRMLEVSLNDFKDCSENVFEKFSIQLEILVGYGLIEITDGKIRLTTLGILWGNNICKEFYSEEYRKTLPSWQRMEVLARKNNID